ncbi:MAG TPA: hypothetical protein VLN57_15765 [Xanthobacteraceae bacterium]|nr:hypothetical protein [Xanthobacteraceae bacterium]
MRRREFIAHIGGAAVAWPVLGHAQQRVMPVVGVLCTGTAQALERYLASFREGMRRLGYVEGTNVRFEFRFAELEVVKSKTSLTSLMDVGFTPTSSQRRRFWMRSQR